MYVYLSSGDSLEYHPRNDAVAFKVKLPKTINFEGDGWQVGLLEIQIPPFVQGYDTPYLLVNSPLCEDSIVNESLQPCLRRIFRDDLHDVKVNFNPVWYTDIGIKSCDVISVYITDAKSQPPALQPNISVECTLHFKRLSD